MLNRYFGLFKQQADPAQTNTGHALPLDQLPLGLIMQIVAHLDWQDIMPLFLINRRMYFVHFDNYQQLTLHNQPLQVAIPIDNQRWVRLPFRDINHILAANYFMLKKLHALEDQQGYYEKVNLALTLTGVFTILGNIFIGGMASQLIAGYCEHSVILNMCDNRAADCTEVSLLRSLASLAAGFAAGAGTIIGTLGLLAHCTSRFQNQSQRHAKSVATLRKSMTSINLEHMSKSLSALLIHENNRRRECKLADQPGEKPALRRTKSM